MKLVQSCLSSRWEPPPDLGERLEYLPPPNGKHATFSTIVTGAFTPTTLSNFRERQKVGALHVLDTYLVGGGRLVIAAHRIM